MAIGAAPDPDPDPDLEPTPNCTQVTERHYAVPVRDRAAFRAFRTPLAGDTDLDMGHPGYDVREGLTQHGDWVVQCVFVPLPAAHDGTHAEELASEVVARLEH